MKKININWKKAHIPDIWIIIGILIYSLFVWWPTRYLPYHWDSAIYIINAAQELYLTNFASIVPSFADFAHPPLLQLLVALGWKTVQHQPLISHIIMFPFLPILMKGTYDLGKHFANSISGIIAALLVGLTPFVLAEYGMIYIDLPAAALGTWALAKWLENSQTKSIIGFTIAGMLKFTGLWWLTFIIGYTFVIKRQKPSKKTAALFIPFLLPIIWLLHHYQVTSWLWKHPDKPGVDISGVQDVLNSAKFVAYIFFIRQGRWLLSLSALATALVYRKQVIKFFKQPTVQLVSLGILTMLLAYAILGEYIPRYTMVIWPAYVVICVTILNKYLPNPYLFLGISAAAAAAFILSWYPPAVPRDQFILRSNEDLAYKDLISLGQQTAQYIETNHPQAIVYGGFPENYQLFSPYQGYVSQQIAFKRCDEFQPLPGTTQLIYFHTYNFTQIPCHNLLSTIQAKELQEFTAGNSWQKLLQVVPATTSATLN